MKTTYSEYSKNETNLGKRLHPTVAATGNFKLGEICVTCNNDDDLRGWFTRNEPLKRFNYNKLKKHAFTFKHCHRCDEEE